MKIYNNILETIGNTPLVRINKITQNIEATVLAKIETFNPGNSVKDRMAIKMIEDAEEQGLLKPGGTIIEGTSGNTGMGLALGCIIKGYKLICVLSDKQSKEKMDILRALGAEVEVCPTDVAPEDPRSYYSVSKRLAEETPNSWYVNQYDNLSNQKAHYEQTGPEIWEQTDGKITHFISGVGTGGTISGVGKYLKEKNPDIQIIGIDTYGSVFKKYHETGVFDDNEVYSYITEGIGEDILPKNVDFSVIDHFEKVTDRDAAIYTRKLAREEGIFVGNSAGSAIKGILQMKEKFKKDDVVVVLFHDHGSRYVGKFFNDDWMKEMGFLDKACKTAGDIVVDYNNKSLVTIGIGELVFHAVTKMRNNKVSQLPVMKDGNIIGVVDESAIFDYLKSHKNGGDHLIEKVMKPALPIVKASVSIDELSNLFEGDLAAVLVEMEDGSFQLISKYDLICSVV